MKQANTSKTKQTSRTIELSANGTNARIDTVSEGKMMTKRKRSKYKNIKTEVDGHKFDSKKEAKRYDELKKLVRVGEIKDLKLQPRFELLPTQREQGETLAKTSYVADFEYIDVKTGKTIIEDVKGMKTPIYKLKRKLMMFRHGILIKEV